VPATIGELSLATGVPIATLRDWDRRHGLSPSHRTIGNHRRYTETDAMMVVRVRDLVGSGLRLRASVAQARAEMLHDRALAASAGTDLDRAEADHERLRSNAVATREAFVARRDELVAAREALVARRRNLVREHRETLAVLASEIAHPAPRS
jgi:DNA-binding transcriptional MerR regulator